MLTHTLQRHGRREDARSYFGLDKSLVYVSADIARGVDLSPSNNQPTIQSAIAPGADGGIYFPGVNSTFGNRAISFGTLAPFGNAAQPRTLMAMVRPIGSYPASEGRIVTSDQARDGYFVINLHPDGTVQLAMNDGTTWYGCVPQSVAPLNAYTHFCAVIVPSNYLAIGINGRFENIVSCGAMGSGPNPLTVGDYLQNTPNIPFTGHIKALTFLTRALSAKEYSDYYSWLTDRPVRRVWVVPMGGFLNRSQIGGRSEVFSERSQIGGRELFNG